MSVATYTDNDGNTLEITPNDEWINYGDVNPKIHGGVFIRWDPDMSMWHIIETRHGLDMPDGYISDSEIEITEYYAELQDLFENGDPDNGPSDYLEREINALSCVPNYENALIDHNIEYFLHGLTHWQHGEQPDKIDESDYWQTLEKKGIPTEKFK